jgi:hypothetical protein
MSRLIVSILAVALTLPAQKIDTETPARDKVVRVQTALNHLTVIEVAEPVATVAVGSPQAFKVERRENKVFIQPLQEGAATNLFIWTATTRLNYELVPAISDASQMDFAIDYREPQGEAELKQPAALPKPAIGPEIPLDMLLHGTPVKLVGSDHSRPQRVNVVIRHFYRTESQVFIWYTIENHSDSPYQPSNPRVVSLKSPHSDRPLTSLASSQLGEEHLSHLRSDGEDNVPIVHTQPPAGVGPGKSETGVIVIQPPPLVTDADRNGKPTVLRLVFPPAGENQVTATLVL